MNHIEYGLYAILWLSFGFVHSILASASIKRILNPLFGPAYRLSYNLFSTLHIGFVIIGGQLLLAENLTPYNLGSEFDVLITLCRWIGIAIILASLTQYDLGLFSGLTQLRRDYNSTDDEPLHLSGLHRYVRHPIYLGAYLYLWGGVVDEFGLQTALWGSAYLFIGTWFEERKLITQYGSSYVEYRKKVPAVLPFRGRAI